MPSLFGFFARWVHPGTPRRSSIRRRTVELSVDHREARIGFEAVCAAAEAVEYRLEPEVVIEKTVPLFAAPPFSVVP